MPHGRRKRAAASPPPDAALAPSPFALADAHANSLADTRRALPRLGAHLPLGAADTHVGLGGSGQVEGERGNVGSAKRRRISLLDGTGGVAHTGGETHAGLRKGPTGLLRGWSGSCRRGAGGRRGEGGGFVRRASAGTMLRAHGHERGSDEGGDEGDAKVVLTDDAGVGLDDGLRARVARQVPVLALRIQSRACGKAMQQLAASVLRLPRIKSVIADPSPPPSMEGSADTKLILIQPEGGSEGQGVGGKSRIPEEVARFAAEHGGEVVPWDVRIGYEQLNAVEVLKMLLPDDITVPSAFEQVGHIAHVNLRDEALPHRRLIGEVILDKNPHIQTVVNKVGAIENEFRVFNMEIIAGEASFITEVRQRGLRFRLDYSAVYWNSRLEGEHHELADTFLPGEEIWDMFCGIGLF